MSAAPQLRVVGIAGSLRTGSYNRALLAAARELAPATLAIDIADLAPLPLYNADEDTDERRPAAVVQLKHAVAAADGLLIVTPEYNHSVPGVLQNAIDWVSRPALKSPLRDRPVALMGASTSLIGTARAQEQLKLVLLSTLALVLPHPGVVVTQARDKFEDGRLVHEPTRAFVQKFLHDFHQWMVRLQ